MSENRYLVWQEKLSSRKLYRLVWSALGIYSVVIFLIVGAVLCIGPYRGVALLAGLAFIFARLIISPLIFSIYKKQRPYQRYNLQTYFSLWLSTRSKRYNSFPSDHALSLASISFVCYWYLPTLGIVLFALTAINGWARIILGYHDEWDIAGGWIIGLIAAFLAIHFIGPMVFTGL